MGLAAAITEHLALKEVTIPALEILIVCCSIASWIEVRSASFIYNHKTKLLVRHHYAIHK